MAETCAPPCVGRPTPVAGAGGRIAEYDTVVERSPEPTCAQIGLVMADDGYDHVVGTPRWEQREDRSSAVETRRPVAAVAGIRPLSRPVSVAGVGTSRRPGEAVVLASAAERACRRARPVATVPVPGGVEVRSRLFSGPTSHMWARSPHSAAGGAPRRARIERWRESAAAGR